MSKLRICLVSSEIAPFAKTGGLADVVAGLGRWLGRQGHDVRVFMPRYATLKLPAGVRLDEDVGFGPMRVSLRGMDTEFGAARTWLPDSRVPVYFVDCPSMYGRDRLYSSEWADEHVRFGLLCRAAIECCQRMQWGPDVFHVHDWHTAALPLYLKTVYAWDRLFAQSRTVLTIHNIGFQGVFGPHAVQDLGLGDARQYFHQDDLGKGQVNLLKTGILHADWLTTVSETYAREIRSSDLGMGLQDALAQRADAMTGILNGVDHDEWDPAIDPLIPARYTADDLSGKARCKQALLERFNLGYDQRACVIGIVSRLTAQKGLDLLPDVATVLLHEEGVRLIVLGSGEQHYERYFQWLRDRFPHQVGVYFGYHEELAHWIEAGADAFLMPSRFEPCGMNQMYSLKYGTVPVVRRTGGLADSVTEFDPRTGQGDGFTFDAFDSGELLQACRRMLQAWRQPDAWSRIVRNGMGADFSWDRQGPRYVDIYLGLTGRQV